MGLRGMGALGAKGGRNMCSIMGANGYVRLQFFRGAELDDPTSALEGTGKAMRHLKVHCNQPLPEESPALACDGCDRVASPASSRVLKNPNASGLSLPPHRGGRCHVVAEGAPAVPEQIRHAVASGATGPPLPSASPPAVNGGREGSAQPADFSGSLLGRLPHQIVRRVGNRRRCN